MPKNTATEIKKKVIIKNQLGLHIRAASKLVEVANKYQADINIRYQDRIINGKSIMGLMTLAAKQGTELEIIASGQQASETITALTNLIDGRFGEKN